MSKELLGNGGGNLAPLFEMEKLEMEKLKMNERYPTIKEGADPGFGLYELRDTSGRRMANLQTFPDGSVVIQGSMSAILIKPLAANSIVITFER